MWFYSFPFCESYAHWCLQPHQGPCHFCLLFLCVVHDTKCWGGSGWAWASHGAGTHVLLASFSWRKYFSCLFLAEAVLSPLSRSSLVFISLQEFPALENSTSVTSPWTLYGQMHKAALLGKLLLHLPAEKVRAPGAAGAALADPPVLLGLPNAWSYTKASSVWSQQKMLGAAGASQMEGQAEQREHLRPPPPGKELCFRPGRQLLYQLQVQAQDVFKGFGCFTFMHDP